MMCILITVLRKGASKRLELATTERDMLSICQIFESTTDVVNYTVVHIDLQTFIRTDKYLLKSHRFEKWIQVETK